jgi:hypothetical protein
MISLDGDSLFFFNYRSDRMREIVTVIGLLDKPVEVTIPKDLVCHLLSKDYFLCSVTLPLDYHNDVTVQQGIPLRSCFPSSGYDQRPR